MISLRISSRKADEDPTSSLPTSVPMTPGRPFPIHVMVLGMTIVVLFVGLFSTWMKLAPVESAVVSPGLVSVAGYRKRVQHLEGGIVEEILVQDGDRVAKGQTLVILSNVRPAATLAQLEGQYVETLATVARLFAERDEADAIQFPEELIQRIDEPEVASVINGQRNIFETRRSLARERHLVLEKRIAQAREEIIGLAGQISAGNRQQALLHDELEQVEALFEKKLTPRMRLLGLQQSLAKLDGELSALHAETARIEQSILEMQLKMSEDRAAQLARVTAQLGTERAALFDVRQRLVSARDVLRRTKIVSPIEGIIVNLQLHTEDGVVGGGQTIMEIVPIKDDLVVEAFINPEDIDEVRSGMPADIQLTSLSRRTRTPIAGIVADVSADRLTDPQTGLPYYRARIELASTVEAEEKAQMMAGMGADVFIRTGARSPIDYLLAPITRSVQLGLREN